MVSDLSDDSLTRDLDTRLVRTFAMVAEEMSFSGAARRLGMTQQGVSSHVRRLEGLLAVPLFERSRSHVALTERGESLLGHARQVLMATENLFAATSTQRSPVRVAEIRGRRMMQQCYATFRREHPQQPVTFFDMLSREQTKAIAEGHLDIGMGRLLAPVPGLNSMPFRLDPVLALNVTDPGPVHLRSGRVGYTGGGSERFANWVSFCRELSVSTGAHLVPVPHDNTMLEAIGQGQMAGELPPVLAMAGMRDYPSAEYFDFRPLEDIQPYYPWRIFWRTNESRREVRAFLSTALAVAREQRWMELLDRDVEIWLPRDGEDHLRPGARMP
ncbi:LysR family transcriptional regulator [Nocardioides acrostichi]|uniref:LysR family transcriptional regulator n=1 Tax=Nocardioides acrostichi TaxID=2784339 RepID=A0A930Y8I3_9ACTN|nr:LysR family transcriptional regulator [Nocardioides acrostichi]MBF4163101.1 LysR family transcriptional regulator [Nocardioides acrostichi]